MNNRGCIHAMFIECLDNTLDVPDPDPHLHPHSPPSSPPLPPTLDDACILPPIANICVPTIAPNTDFSFCLYTQRDLLTGTHSPLAFPVVDFTNLALILLVSLYNVLLDVRCTHHIIRDCDLFSNYVQKEILVGTANCGSLSALGMGDVNFCYLYGDRFINFAL